MSGPIDDFARVTLSGARNASDGSAPSREQIDRVISYLKSPGSGVDAGSSFEDYVRDRLGAHPARLPDGHTYVAFSGTDSNGRSNFSAASEYIEAHQGRAGIIGDTPWGNFIESPSARTELRPMPDRLAVVLEREGLVPRGGQTVAALQDMMWNSGSPDFMRNSMNSGRPVVAMVDGAPERRGFAAFALPVAQEHPDRVINGHRVSSFGKGPDALDRARQSSIEYGRMERSVATSLGLDPDNASHVERMRGRLDLARGFDAQTGTVFGERIGALSARDLDSFGKIADEWSLRNPGLSVTATRPGISPGMTRVGAAATGIGVALTAAEGNEAIQRSNALYDMGNATGARSELIHFGSRSVGAWGGALLGAGFGASVSSPTGPGAIIGGIVGGGVGLVGGAKVAEVLDHRSIYRQQDGDGKTWVFSPDHPEHGWRRNETIEQTGPDGIAFERTRDVVASSTLASELDRKATTVSFDLMLARPPVPRDPYTLPAEASDARSMPPTNWQRDPASGEWRRPIQEWRADASELGQTTVVRVDTADAARAAQLDAASQAILRDNVHLAPAAMAARYELAYRDRGWESAAPLPGSAQQALRDDGRLVASDGAEYRRQGDGGWQRQALFGLTTADANPRIAAELDATRGLLQEGLREHRALMAERPQPAPPSFEQKMAEGVESAYRQHGLTRPEGEVQSLSQAMVLDHRARGLDGPFMLQLERDPITKQYGPDSPMGLYTRGADGDMSLRFTMTPQEARELLAAPQRTPAAPALDVSPAPSPAPAPLAPSRAEAAPRDPLNESMRDFVHAMDRSLGRTPDDASDRVAAALTAEWRANGLTARPDGVVLGQKGTRAEAGEYVFAYSGSSERPNDWVGVKTAEAVQTPVDQSLAKAETLAGEQAIEAQQMAQARQQDSARAMG